MFQNDISHYFFSVVSAMLAMKKEEKQDVCIFVTADVLKGVISPCSDENKTVTVLGIGAPPPSNVKFNVGDQGIVQGVPFVVIRGKRKCYCGVEILNE